MYMLRAVTILTFELSSSQHQHPRQTDKHT